MSEWIDVKERTPDDDSVVIATGWEYGKPGGTRWTAIARLVGFTFYEESTGDDLYMPTHWMELPELPK